MARFSKCAVVTNWLPHTLVQIFFGLLLVHKIVWCSLSSLSIQTVDDFLYNSNTFSFLRSTSTCKYLSKIICEFGNIKI